MAGAAFSVGPISRTLPTTPTISPETVSPHSKLMRSANRIGAAKVLAREGIIDDEHGTGTFVVPRAKKRPRSSGTPRARK